MKKSILIVEDDVLISTVLKRQLEAKGHIVYQAFKGDVVKRTVLRDMPDCIVLDIDLPNMNGFEVFQDLKQFYKGPIVFLTSKSSEHNELTGLKLGAADFINKQKSFEVFYQRIHKLLTDTTALKKDEDYQMQFGSFLFDKKLFQCGFSNNNIKLTSDEFELLYYLLINKDRLITRDEFYIILKGYPYDGMNRNIDVGISRLKDKLSKGGVDRHVITAVRGKGYILDSVKLTGVLSSEELELLHLS